MSHETFFMHEVPNMLKELKSESKGQWGSLTAPLMLDHLRRALDLSISEDIEVEVLTAEDRIPRFKSFLMSDGPFVKDAQQPKEFEKIDSFDGDFEDLKVNLLKSLVRVQVYFESNPDHKKNHPDFGELNVTEWLQLHKKHFTHHFTQFGLIQKQG